GACKGLTRGLFRDRIDELAQCARKCLDFLITVSADHLKKILHEWVGHYNRGLPHSSLGPGIRICPKPKFRQVQTDMSCPTRTVSNRCRSSVEYIMMKKRLV